MHIANTIGQRIDPWGATYNSRVVEYMWLTIKIEKHIFDRYDTNHSWDFPEIPAKVFSLLKMMV